MHLHGARIDEPEAISRGLAVYRALACAAPAEQPISFVIWSWPTSKNGRPLRDLRAMATRSDLEAAYLAGVLAHLDRNTTIDLFGFSYGARAVTGAMHLISGGTLLGRTLPASHRGGRQPVNVVLWSPALHNYWLLPGQYHGRAMESTGRMLIIYNSCDRALKHYHWVVEGRPQGLGHTGLPNRALGETARRIAQYDACADLGREHSFYNHLNSQRLLNMTRNFFYPRPPSGKPALAASGAAKRG